MPTTMRSSPRNASGKPRRVRAARNAEDGSPDTQSQTDIATASIRESILDLSLSPGTRLDDKVLLRRFGVGRTPAREALNRLVSEGLVEMLRNRGAFVRPLDIETIQQFFDAYAASERLNGFFCRTEEPGLVDELTRLQARYERTAASRRWLDVTRVNTQLHLRIAASTGNQYILDFAARLQNQGRRISFFIYRMEAENRRALDRHQGRINVDHAEAIAAIRRNDNAGLVDVLTRHVGLFHERIMRVLGATRGLQAPLPVRL
jgi:DNA-binding GntR family transcriptional regulator